MTHGTKKTAHKPNWYEQNKEKARTHYRDYQRRLRGWTEEEIANTPHHKRPKNRPKVKRIPKLHYDDSSFILPEVDEDGWSESSKQSWPYLLWKWWKEHDYDPQK